MKKVALVLLAASLLFSCIDSNDDCDNGATVPISLTSKIVVSERGSQQDVQIVAGQTASLFVLKAGDEEILYDNVLLTADGNGFFDAGGLAMYFPAEPINVDFYALHPYDETADIHSEIQFTVQEDQSIRKNYYDSDLLYSRVFDIEKTRQPIPMVFFHKLSKLTLVVKQGPGIDLSGLTSVGVMNVLNEVSMNVSNGSLIIGGGVETEIEAYGVRGAIGGETEVDGMAAIIAPQLFHGNGARDLFRIAINGTKYFYTPTQDIYFEEGKVYNYILTVSSTGIQVSSSINDWYPGGNIEGEAS